MTEPQSPGICILELDEVDGVLRVRGRCSCGGQSEWAPDITQAVKTTAAQTASPCAVCGDKGPSACARRCAGCGKENDHA